jgi:molybdenum cofactor cytidylyltransferase
MRATTRRQTSSLARALGLPRSGVVAFVGAGGKTASIRRLLRERPRAIATTTTHLARDGFARGLLAVLPDTASLRVVETELLTSRPVTLAVRENAARVRGPDLAWQARFADSHPDELLLVEADGAARAEIKLPGAREPAWPPGKLACAVIVVGCRALGRPLAAAAHHPERFRAQRLGAIVEVEHLAAMLRDYLQATPPGVPIRVLLAGLSTESEAHVGDLADHARRVVRQREPLWNDPAVSLRVVAARDEQATCEVWHIPTPKGGSAVRLPGVCAVLLAAGAGTRFDADVESKLLARWRGPTPVAHAVRRWCAAGFAEILVVTGHAAAAVRKQVARAAPHDARLRLVHNRHYRRGLGTSVRAAARAATPGMAILFGHADMPAVRTDTLRRIADVGTQLRDRVVVPWSDAQPTNPVYFPPTFRASLRRARDGEGGRSVYRAHPDLVFQLEMAEGTDLVDVDRVGDLHRL